MKTAAFTILTALTLTLMSSSAVLAGPKCLCRANGTTFEEGQIACIKLPSGNKLARCEKVLNNTSWKMLGDGCPSARLMSLPSTGGQSSQPPIPLSLPGEG